MEVVKDYLDCVNVHWIVVVTTGMYMHLRQICIIGLCLDEEISPPFDPSYASVIFIFSVLCLLAEYRLWPASLKEPPVQLLFIYDMLVTALVTNLSTRAVWIPIMNGIWCLTQESSRWVTWLNTTVGLDDYSILTTFASYMATEDAAVHMAFCLSVLSFVWMLDATESLDAILDAWKQTISDVVETDARADFTFPMTKLLCTIWALFLNTLGVSIFRTCFANAMEDEDGEALLTGPPITSFFFASGVYTIILSLPLFPSTFQKPKAYILCAYEFLATAFLLEFSIACIWTPIDVLILTTMPKTICNILTGMQLNEEAELLMSAQGLMVAMSCLLALGFLVLSLQVTRSVDFTILNECGFMTFAEYCTERLWRRITSELPKKASRCRRRKKSRSRTRKRSSS